MVSILRKGPEYHCGEAVVAVRQPGSRSGQVNAGVQLILCVFAQFGTPAYGMVLPTFRVSLTDPLRGMSAR